MGEPFLGEIRIVSFNFPPEGWALCNGQLMPINQNQALFSILGTTYGGNGQTTFGLPDLRGRTPVHTGNGVNLGQSSGQESVTLLPSAMPAHTHIVSASSQRANKDNPTNAYWAAASSGNRYATGSPSVTMHPSAVTSVGGSQAHPNMQPYLVLQFIIALVGIFPSRN